MCKCVKNKLRKESGNEEKCESVYIETLEKDILEFKQYYNDRLANLVQDKEPFTKVFGEEYYEKTLDLVKYITNGCDDMLERIK